MQTAGMYFKQQVRQPKSTAMDNECRVQLAIIGYSLAIDEILEANNVSYCLLAVPNRLLVAWYLALLGDPQTTTIALHHESVDCLPDLCCELLVTT
jgi:hypothetical protein